MMRLLAESRWVNARRTVGPTREVEQPLVVRVSDSHANRALVRGKGPIGRELHLLLTKLLRAGLRYCIVRPVRRAAGTFGERLTNCWQNPGGFSHARGSGEWRLRLRGRVVMGL